MTGNLLDSEVFSVKPSVGEIDADSFILICIRFSPKTTKKYSEMLRLYVNGNKGKPDRQLILEGSCLSSVCITP